MRFQHILKIFFRHALIGIPSFFMFFFQVISMRHFTQISSIGNLSIDCPDMNHITQDISVNIIVAWIYSVSCCHFGSISWHDKDNGIPYLYLRPATFDVTLNSYRTHPKRSWIGSVKLDNLIKKSDRLLLNPNVFFPFNIFWKSRLIPFSILRDSDSTSLSAKSRHFHVVFRYFQIRSMISSRSLIVSLPGLDDFHSSWIIVTDSSTWKLPGE
jgi:hypothetical protein